jgi:hypothetical protein
MRLTVGRLAVTAVAAAGIGLALPAGAVADSRAQDSPPQAGRSAISLEGTLPHNGAPGTAPGTDSALLIGVGVAALAGAAGLFAAAQYTGRRS